MPWFRMNNFYVSHCSGPREYFPHFCTKGIISIVFLGIEPCEVDTIGLADVDGPRIVEFLGNHDA